MKMWCSLSDGCHGNKQCHNLWRCQIRLNLEGGLWKHFFSGCWNVSRQKHFVSELYSIIQEFTLSERLTFKRVVMISESCFKIQESEFFWLFIEINMVYYCAFFTKTRQRKSRVVQKLESVILSLFDGFVWW